MLGKDSQIPAAVHRRAIGGEGEHVQVLIVESRQQGSPTCIQDLGVGRAGFQAMVERDHHRAVDPYVDPATVDLATTQQGAHDAGGPGQGIERLGRRT